MALAPMLRELAKRNGVNGYPGTVGRYYMREGDRTSLYWDAHTKGFGDMTQADWDRLARLSRRYQRFCQYMTEVAPRWQEAKRTYWADNSISVEEVNRHGKHRTRMIVAPSGDRCF